MTTVQPRLVMVAGSYDQAEVPDYLESRRSSVERAVEARGDDPEVAELFREHGEAIYNYCFRRTADRAMAEDLTQQVFLIAWKSRKRAAPFEGTYAPWLYGIANNVCRRHHRNKTRGAAALRRWFTPGGAHTNPTETAHEDAERVRAVLDRVAQLPQAHQDVFFLVLWEELSYASAAEALGIPVGTVRSRLSRIRTTLQLADRNHDHD